MNFAALERLCAEKGMTVSAVAKDLGMSSASVTNWKRGSNARPATIAKLASYLGCDPGALFEDPKDDGSDYNELWNRYADTAIQYMEQNGLGPFDAPPSPPSWFTPEKPGGNHHFLFWNYASPSHGNAGWPLGGRRPAPDDARIGGGAPTAAVLGESELLGVYRALGRSRQHLLLSRAYELLDEEAAAGYGTTVDGTTQPGPDPSHVRSAGEAGEPEGEGRWASGSSTPSVAESV